MAGKHHLYDEISMAQVSEWALFSPTCRESPTLSIWAPSSPVALRTGMQETQCFHRALPLGGLPHTSPWPGPQLFPFSSVLAPIVHPSDAYCPEKEWCSLLSPGHLCLVTLYQEACTSLWSNRLLTQQSWSPLPPQFPRTGTHGLVPYVGLLVPLGHLCLPGEEALQTPHPSSSLDGAALLGTSHNAPSLADII